MAHNTTEITTVKGESVLSMPGLGCRRGGDGCAAGIVFNDHLENDGATVFAHACKLGCEGHCLEGSDETLPVGAKQDSRDLTPLHPQSGSLAVAAPGSLGRTSAPPPIPQPEQTNTTG